jgi:hypothetical protein
MKLEFSWQILEQILNLMKICPVWGELLHAGGRTDKKKLIVFFLIFRRNLLIHSSPPQFRILHFPRSFPTKILQVFLAFPFSAYV